MYLYHNSRKPEYRSPYGAVPVGTALTLCVDAHDLPQNGEVFVRLWSGQEQLIPMTRGGQNRYTVTISVPDTPGLLWYYFDVKYGGETRHYGRPPHGHHGEGTWMEQPESWQVTVYTPTELPQWYGQSVVYQIFPDRFARGRDFEACQAAAALPENWKGSRRMVMQEWNDTPFYCRDLKGRVVRWPFFGGNFSGIEEKLPYLRSMGIGVIYLNPIFLATSNHKYDTADYMTIDPSFGTEEDFSHLCAAAKAAGIRIILDGVFSHTGDDSIYFNRYGNFPAPGACNPEPSPYDSWYRFGDQYPSGYECWWGVDSLPDVEENDPSYQEFICGENGVLRKWLRLGASGWRLDVADELPDSFIRAIRQAVKAENPDALLLGEVWEDASHKISYHQLREYLLGEELDATMHYPFRTAAMDYLLGKLSAGDFSEAMETIRENYPESAFYGAMNLIGTHDTPRAMTILGEAPEGLTEAQQEYFRLDLHHRWLGKTRLQLLYVLMFTFPGVPCVYYGDEAAMEGYGDPFNRGTFPWGNEDQVLQSHVRMLSHLRKEYPVLVSGSAAFHAVDWDVFLVERTLEDTSALIYVNRSQMDKTIVLPEHAGSRLDLLTGNVIKTDTFTLRGLSAAVLYREGDREGFSPLPEAARTPSGRGVLLPMFSLPCDKGQGPMGAPAEEFLSAIKEAGYSSWMLLPLNPAGVGNSPYSSFGLFAGDSRFIDPATEVNMEGFQDFCRENDFWLEDYAIYTVLHGQFDRPWQQWPARERDRKNLPSIRKKYAKEIRAIMEEQYRFFCQYHQLRVKAKQQGIALIGDLPIYAALDGADTWAHRELFQLDEKGYPTLRAGCPPDYFSPEGQDWGNPLYNWDVMEQDDFDWWRRRLEAAFRLYDYVRLDHFRSFAAYYAIPAGKSAKYGYWMKGAGIKFFRVMEKAFGTLPIIAEDLGTLDNQVYTLMHHTGLSGMNVWQFSAGEMAEMPPEQAAARVFFSGTHDNQTLQGFLNAQQDTRPAKEILRELTHSPAAAVILPVQDILGLDDSARVNVPGTSDGNWTWVMTKEQLSDLRKGGILAE